MKPDMTPTIAYALGTDAGNRSMRAGNRGAWSVDDWTAACRAFEHASGYLDTTPAPTTAPAPD